MDSTPLEKIMKVIEFLENWKLDNAIPKKIFISEFLFMNNIYLEDTQQCIITNYNNYERKKYYFKPFLEVHSEKELRISLYDEN